MRLLPCVVLLGVLSSCAATPPYTPQDFREVNHGYSAIRPTYQTFRQGFLTGNQAGIIAQYKKIESQCKLVDRIDVRDTIDPNINLFQVSALLDSMCNAVEAAYAYWALHHGRHYDKRLVPQRAPEVFLGADKSLLLAPAQLKHPKALS